MSLRAMPIQEVVILDPGLREFGGHHPALIEGLGRSSALLNAGIKVTVYANKQCDLALLTKLSKGNVTVSAYFHTDFYLNFYKDERASYYTSYIHSLAAEYMQAMSTVENDSAVFLHHTLNWEHAYALSLAISLCQQSKGSQHQHLACLMYSPCAYNESGALDPRRYFKFNLAFRALNKHSNVELFAAEHELTQHYESMLSCQIASHPCGLLSEQDLTAVKQRAPSNNILLYVGDAKDNKGFLQLPELVRSLSASITDPDISFVLQYTITNDRADLAEIDRQLKHIQATDSRIVLHTHFLTAQEMHLLWLNIGHCVLNYDPIVYQYQSSGVLWLAAAYQAKIYFMTTTWLNREAERLGCHYDNVSDVTQLTHQLINHQEKTQQGQTEKANQSMISARYRANLFADFGGWLVSQTNTLKEASTWNH